MLDIGEDVVTIINETIFTCAEEVVVHCAVCAGEEFTIANVRKDRFHSDHIVGRFILGVVIDSITASINVRAKIERIAVHM